MPGIAHRNERSGNAVPAAVVCSSPVSAVGYAPASNGIWSKHRDEISFDQLQKFWCELPLHARQQLLRIDKQMLFEQARKNLYCSRCNGLLLEGFSQIVLYGKSMQLESAGSLLLEGEILKNVIDRDTNDVQDPSVHPWGGLIATRDGTLTLMDCYLYAKSLWILQNVFDSARARERERELLYPDACGGGGRGWISHGVANYGRIHGTRETCALHTARLSCDTLVDFWSALGDETRSSLLRMKEEDFVERLMYRFDSKRFCRDCRRNVIREFKELKELKRLRRETHCTNWFCVADTAFHYEVSDDTVQADWHQSFTDTVGTYHHFEWAVGTAEGKSDILDFEDVGMTLEVQANGLALGGLDACFITLRAWRLDGRCTELTVKAHALKGQSCVHRRLVVGDGFVTITKGESIRRFFEHAEEAEEEEDDDAIDKDGNELDSDGARPQKHAKSPELAREFLLDAATVIFKEQVEKAFREGTARQNAHSIFVCLALKLLEERIHVACKEIITLEKQIKLLEEEEKEKREEEERRERRRAKEREKKLRRKERLKEKERVKGRKETEIDVLPVAAMTSPDGSTVSSESPSVLNSGNSDCEEVEHLLATTPDIVDGQSVDRSVSPRGGNSHFQHYDDAEHNERGADGSFMHEQLKSARRKLRFKQDSPLNQSYKWSDKRRSNDDVNIHYCDSEMKTNGYMMATSKNTDGMLRHSKANSIKTITRNCNTKFSDKFHCSKHRTHDGYENHFCGCNNNIDRRLKEGQSLPVVRPGRGAKTLNKPEGTMDTCRQLYHSTKYNHNCYAADHSLIPKGKPVLGNGHLNRGALSTKKVWEPLDSRKKCTRNGYDCPASLRSAETDPTKNTTCDAIDSRCEQSHETPQSSDENSCKQLPSCSEESDPVCHENSGKLTNTSEMNEENISDCKLKDVELCSVRPIFPVSHSCHLLTNSSSSDNSSLSLSEGDSSSSSFSAQSAESTSDSEDASQQCEVRDDSTCNPNGCHAFQGNVANDEKNTGACSLTSEVTTEFPVVSCTGAEFSKEKLTRNAPICDAARIGYEQTAVQQPKASMHNHGFHLPYYPSLAVGYHNQSQASWSAISSNGMLSYSQPHQYIYPSPLGYGLQATHPSDYFMQYNGLQNLEPPLFNVSRTPNYQPLSKVIIANSNEQMKIFRTDGNPQADGTHNATRCANKSSSGGCISPRPAFIAERNGNENTDKLHKEIPSFSLFHSGGPLAVVSRCNLDQAQAENNLLDTETKVEEYSLFASKSARFSFF